MLPEEREVKIAVKYLPTTWQTVIFSYYGLISAGNIAKVLRCDEDTVKREAERLGLTGFSGSVGFEKRGYITAIRNAWFILPYRQICELIGKTEKELDAILENEDFLRVKLGDFKPKCEEVIYAPLSEEQKAATARVADKISALAIRGGRYFDFFSGKDTVLDAVKADGNRIIHGYLTPCYDVFSRDCEEYVPDGLLAEYAARGINGLWVHGLLSSLSPYPFDEEKSAGYGERRQNLKRLIERAAEYGIKIYLYFNEPRALETDGFSRFPELKGRTEGKYSALCFSKEETRQYLYNAVKDLVSAADGLGGIMTITMSENLTHCNYRPGNDCPYCRDVPPERTAADVNNVIMRAVKDSGKDVEVIANLWGWSPFMGWDEERTMRGLSYLDKDVSVMCVSEYGLKIEKGGTPSEIIDYSISNVGPSELTVKVLSAAKAQGHKIYAKIQINDSWECSAVPYLPVYDLQYEHIKKLSAIGVKDFMLTWTLGGYPSPVMDLVAEYADKGEDFSLWEWYKKIYGNDAETARRAVKKFCEGFAEYPFSIDGLYYSPKTLGQANLCPVEDSGLRSTMVCYSYDDYETWVKPYGVEVYLSQYKKLLEKWKEGIDLCGEAEGLAEMKRYALAAYLHFRADALQTEFAYVKRKSGTEKRIKYLFSEMKKDAETLISLMREDGTIGYETSNHYFYTDRDLIAKILYIDAVIGGIGEI